MQANKPNQVDAALEIARGNILDSLACLLAFLSTVLCRHAENAQATMGATMIGPQFLLQHLANTSFEKMQHRLTLLLGVLLSTSATLAGPLSTAMLPRLSKLL